MKSIYGKLICGFLLTIVFSFSLTGYIAIKNNYDQIKNTTEDELHSTFEYITILINESNVKDEKSMNTVIELIDKYANSSEVSISLYSKDFGYWNFGNKKLTLSQKEIQNRYLKARDNTIFESKNNLVNYGGLHYYNDSSYYLYVQKDTTEQNSALTSSAILILGCIFLSGSVIFLVIADFIVKPIKRLTSATDELSKGNYSVRVACEGGDEIARLTTGFNHMAQQLSKQDEIRQKFISDISHEFQTPLTSIQGFANILKEEEITKEQKDKYLDIILYNSKRLSTLAKNMIQLTVLESSDNELEMIEYSLSDQLEMTVSSLQSQAKEKNIEIQYNKPKKDVLIYGDNQKLEQVWTNIISNAIKYTNKKGLVIVDIKRVSKGVEVSIEDTGIGMSKESISHIFERFYREDKARNVQGNGLGLAIVKTIVDLHDGNINVTSKVDIGTTFTVFLPMEKTSIKERLNIK